MKKRRNSKGIVITLIVLIIICLACGTIGFLQSGKSEDTKKPEKNKDYKVTYKYYLDGEEVEEMVEQEFIDNENEEFEGNSETTPTYKFEKYACTNNVTGEFDEEEWEFKPDLTNNTTCRLYFIKTMHTVTLKTSNGKLPSGNDEENVEVEIEKDKIINIIPNDGYKFDRVDCNNEVIAEYDENTKDLKLSNVKKDSICTISFKITDYTVEVNVSNGTVSENRKNANYGGTLTFDVTPAENYRFNNNDKINCTNNQKATYKDGKLTVTGITNDTVCSIEFKPIKHQVSLTVINGSIKTGSSNPLSVSDGKNALFEIIANTGFVFTNANIDCKDTKGNLIKAELSSGALSVYNITDNVECKVTLKAGTSN